MRKILSLFMEWRIDRLSTKERYAMTDGEIADLISSASPIDADNGRSATYKMNMGTSDVLGILLALRRNGYKIKRSYFSKL